MDDATAQAFHRAFDTLRGAEAVILDCRGMGGGSDSCAWEMAGRFFSKPVPNGSHGRLEPTGSWQFDGPLVMLQDETEVSSAETFTWALSETERAVSMGRPTGGWGIIPKIFKCPSGLVDFRLGVNHRPTPIRGVLTEGKGWPPDVLVPHGPALCARRDPERELGMSALQLLHAGVRRDQVVAAFADLVSGDFAAWDRKAAAFGKDADGFDPDLLGTLLQQDLEATLRMELVLMEPDDGSPPDAAGALRRLPALKERAQKARLRTAVAALDRAARRLRAEAAAQEELASLLAPDTDPKLRQTWLRRHRRTRTAAWLRDHPWE